MFPLRKITYILLFLMLFIPIIAFFLVVGEIGPFSHVLYFYLLTYVVAVIYFSQNKINQKPHYLNYLILYIFYLFIWAFFNGEIERRGILRFLINNREIATLLIILIIYNTNFSDKFIKNSILIVKITVIIAVVVSIVQVFDQDFFSAYEYRDNEEMINLNIYQFRRTSIFSFADPNELGLSFLPLLSVLIGYLLYLKKRNYIVFLILGGLVAVLTNGRYIIIGFIILTFQILVFNKIKILGTLKYVFIAFISFFILYQIILFLGYDIQSWINQRLFIEGSIKETTRYKAFSTFAIFFPQNPYFGTGVHLTDEIKATSLALGSSQIHVGYLSHLVSYGIIGSLLLFGFWFLLAKELYKKAKQTNYWGSFFAFLIYFWAQATLVKFSIFFYGLIFALVFDKYFYDKYLIVKSKANLFISW